MAARPSPFYSHCRGRQRNALLHGRDPFDVVAELYRVAPPYTFGDDEGLVRRLMELGLENLGEASDLVFPGDLIFVNRTLSGHFGNLSRLRCTADWRSMVRERLPPA